jgi:hypothetical protein
MLIDKRQITKTLEPKINGQQVGYNFESGLQWVINYDTL